ncbi:MAG: polyprenyl synthetase family protein [Candidatus Nitrohelix vancouverensis]|uniref:Polyprenyl synthetase family protein n=1 Tax=Candidatus Nitrohelix vancouverensis TaxID=2705534 RepID=A0A7T0G4F0_9BACT|nr:MAG: polyprenyl synthetase family protein [Candidatus Nitrohelix vancouverensis]
MEFTEVTAELKEDLAKIEKAIKVNYKSDIPLIPGMTSYLMNGGGKRIRPILLLLCAKLGGRTVDDEVVNHGCVVEYIHTATLLHDDVVDETTVRRGHETVNSKWGSDASILVGDFLLSRAILLLADNNDAAIIQAVAGAAKILVEGGIKEYANARKIDVTEEHCLDVIYRKTSSIITASCQVGMLLAKGTPEQVKAVVDFGDQFGMAFQLMDDALDYDGDESILGKPPGTDFKEGHVTLPLLHLYTHSSDTVKKEIEDFIQNENISDKDFQYILGRMRDAKSIEYTQDLARNYMDQAKNSLEKTQFKTPEIRERLYAIANYIIERHTPVRT